MVCILAKGFGDVSHHPHTMTFRLAILLNLHDTTCEKPISHLANTGGEIRAATFPDLAGQMASLGLDEVRVSQIREE